MANLTETLTPYSVLYWGSHPDAENDDCWTGLDFETQEAALAQFQSDANPFTAPVEPAFMTLSCAFLEIDGPDVHEVRANPLYNSRATKRERALDDAEWQSEITWQNRMAFGIEAE